MNRDHIIRMAREAQLINEQGDCMYGDATEQMLAFAAMIAEDCAKRCEAVSGKVTKDGWEDYAVGASFAAGANVSAAAIREAYKP